METEFVFPQLKNVQLDTNPAKITMLTLIAQFVILDTQKYLENASLFHKNVMA